MTTVCGKSHPRSFTPDAWRREAAQEPVKAEGGAIAIPTALPRAAYHLGQSM